MESNTTEVTLTSSFETSFEQGKIFKSISIGKKRCKSDVQLIAQIIKANQTIKNIFSNRTYSSMVKTISPNNMSIYIESDCGFNFHFEVSPDQGMNMASEIQTYMSMNIVSCVFYMISTTI